MFDFKAYFPILVDDESQPKGGIGRSSWPRWPLVEKNEGEMTSWLQLLTQAKISLPRKPEIRSFKSFVIMKLMKAEGAGALQKL